MRLPTLLMLTASCLTTSFLVPTSHSATIQGSFGISTTGYIVAQTISASTYVNAVPTGAVMAFDLTSCPTGWSEYTPARGRFLRGIDNGAGNDPSGTRSVGDIQADLLRHHTHLLRSTQNTDYANIGELGSLGGWGLAQTSTQNKGSARLYAGDDSSSTYNTNTGAETRPKNVAVLFCRKD